MSIFLLFILAFMALPVIKLVSSALTAQATQTFSFENFEKIFTRSEANRSTLVEHNRSTCFRITHRTCYLFTGIKAAETHKYNIFFSYFLFCENVFTI